MPLKRVCLKGIHFSAARSVSKRPSPWSRPLGTLIPPSNRGFHQPPKDPSPQDGQDKGPSFSQTGKSSIENLSSALHDTNPQDNNLLSPVHIPENPNALLKDDHPAAKILANSGLVVQRQLEAMNVLLGFEQANRYVILDAQGNHVGYMAEQEKGMGNMMARQWLLTHRAFVAHVFDKHQNEVLRIHRPFSFINSVICVYDPLNAIGAPSSQPSGFQKGPEGSSVTASPGDSVNVSPLDHSQMRIIGASQQRWAPLRRKYNLFASHPNPTPEADFATQFHNQRNPDIQTPQQSTVPPEKRLDQFAAVDEPFLSWDFSARSADSQLLGSVNRSFSGFAREIFTDTGVYALRMDSARIAEEKSKGDVTLDSHKTGPGMTLDQRAVMLATAVSIDFDYFSRHSSAGGGILPYGLFGLGEGGAGAAAGGAAEGAVGGEAASAATAAGGSLAGGAATGVAGAGTIAGYEAMQRGASPGSSAPQQPQSIPQEGGEEIWGEGENDPWDQRSSGSSFPENVPEDHEASGPEGGDDGWTDIDDFF